MVVAGRGRSWRFYGADEVVIVIMLLDVCTLGNCEQEVKSGTFVYDLIVVAPSLDDSPTD